LTVSAKTHSAHFHFNIGILVKSTPFYTRRISQNIEGQEKPYSGFKDSGNWWQLVSIGLGEEEPLVCGEENPTGTGD